MARSIAGVLVAVLGTNEPDLIIGAAISAVVVTGGFRILRETAAAQDSVVEFDEQHLFSFGSGLPLVDRVQWPDRAVVLLGRFARDARVQIMKGPHLAPRRLPHGTNYFECQLGSARSPCQFTD